MQFAYKQNDIMQITQPRGLLKKPMKLKNFLEANNLSQPEYKLPLAIHQFDAFRFALITAILFVHRIIPMLQYAQSRHAPGHNACPTEENQPVPPPPDTYHNSPHPPWQETLKRGNQCPPHQ